jgi:hypothetical protein
VSTDHAQEGKLSGRLLEVYALPDCVGNGEYDWKARPFNWQSCQTDNDGACHTVPQGIQSFAIVGNNAEQCYSWALASKNAASKSSQSVRVVIGLATIVGLWTLL